MADQKCKKVSQSDLRQLMKERSAKVGKKEERIDSPLAKYDFMGRLSCIACNKEIKVANLWRFHISSKEHKENVSTKLKRKSSDTRSHTTIKKKPEDSITLAKNHVSTSKQTPETNSFENSKSATPHALLRGYSSDEDESMQTDEHSSKTPVEGLPADFFDASLTTTAHPTEKVNDPSTSVKNASEALPEGFFDDPILDAKARHVEYKDPMEEEWEKFQKSMAEETNVSENIMVVDIEKSEVERDIDQIDEQIHNWRKVNALLSKKENTQKVKLEENKHKEISPNNSDVEDDELECMLNWRAKDVFRK